MIPTGTSLISAFCVVLWGFLSDYTGSRFAFVLIPLVRGPSLHSRVASATMGSGVLTNARSAQIYGLIPNGILAFWPASIPLKEFAFLTIAVQLMTAV